MKLILKLNYYWSHNFFKQKKKRKKKMKSWSWEMIKIGFKEHIIYNLFCFYWFILVSLSSLTIRWNDNLRESFIITF